MVRRIFARRAQRLDEAERAVAPIVQDVVREGDRALMRYAAQWDGFEGKSASVLRVTPREIAAARREAGAAFARAVAEAARNVREYCRLQMPRE